MVQRYRPSPRAISDLLSPAAQPSAISSRSANDRCQPDGSARSGIMPPDSAIQLRALVSDTPTSAAASATDTPASRARQNARTRSRGNRRDPAITITPAQKGVAIAP